MNLSIASYTCFNIDSVFSSGTFDFTTVNCIRKMVCIWQRRSAIISYSLLCIWQRNHTSAENYKLSVDSSYKQYQLWDLANFGGWDSSSSIRHDFDQWKQTNTCAALWFCFFCCSSTVSFDQERVRTLVHFYKSELTSFNSRKLSDYFVSIAGPTVLLFS